MSKNRTNVKSFNDTARYIDGVEEREMDLLLFIWNHGMIFLVSMN